MARYILVHGAWHGSWCWQFVAARLKNAGYLVQAPDLPGHGEDTTPAGETTLDLYVERVVQCLEQSSDPAILVGHSMGGVVITQAAEARPEKIQQLVYVAAFLPRDGESLHDYAGGDVDSLVLRTLVVSEDGHGKLNPHAAAELLYGHCEEEVADRAVQRLIPENLAIFTTPVRISGDRFGSVPRAYISCRDDRTISPAVQDKMVASTPCERVFYIDTDHSPFFSTPEKLADMLLSFA